jgi:hypothetical protein
MIPGPALNALPRETLSQAAHRADFPSTGGRRAVGRWHCHYYYYYYYYYYY